MQKASKYNLSGLFFTTVFVFLCGFAAYGQGGIKILKEGTDIVTDPLKTTQKATKEVIQTEKAITNAPKAVTKEVKATEKGFQTLEKDASKLTGNNDHKKNAPADSAAAGKGNATASDGKGGESQPTSNNNAKVIPKDYVPSKKENPATVAKTAAIDPTDVPRPVPPGSRDNKTPSGPMPVEKEVASAASSSDVETQDGANTEARLLQLQGAQVNDAARRKQDYSNSPARIALEKADFDIETLEDLFKYSNWEGPEREHTIRAVQYALDELLQSILEIKKLDPGRSTWRAEESYKEMRAVFIAEKAKGPATSATIDQ